MLLLAGGILALLAIAATVFLLGRETRMAVALLAPEAARRAEATDYWTRRPFADLADSAPYARIVEPTAETLAADAALALGDAFAGEPGWIAGVPRTALRDLLLRANAAPAAPAELVARIEAALDHHARTPPAALDPLAAELLAALATGGVPRFESIALERATTLLGRDAEPLLATLARRAGPDVAREAWLVLGFLESESGWTVDLADMSDDVAAAALFASGWNADDPAAFAAAMRERIGDRRGLSDALDRIARLAPPADDDRPLLERAADRGLAPDEHRAALANAARALKD